MLPCHPISLYTSARVELDDVDRGDGIVLDKAFWLKLLRFDCAVDCLIDCSDECFDACPDNCLKKEALASGVVNEDISSDGNDGSDNGRR